jgi:DNA-binding NarL/FixJ family response regulator
VDKRAPVADLIAAVRRVAAGDTVLPGIPLDLRNAAMSRLGPDDVPVAAMLLAGTTHSNIADALGIDRRDVGRRLRRILGRLRSTGGVRHASTTATAADQPALTL